MRETELIDRSAIFFDLDGTLVESKAAISGCLHEFLREERLNLSAKEVATIHGQPLFQFLSNHYLDAIETHHAVIRFQKAYLGGWIDKISPIAGAKKCLRALRDRGIPICVVSSNQHEVVGATLRTTGLMQFVQHYDGIKMNQAAHRDKSHLLAGQLKRLGVEASTVILIGDTYSDGKAAADNHVPFWAVTYGYGQLHGLTSFKPDRIFCDLAGVLSALLPEI